jgi:hypothetical protein
MIGLLEPSTALFICWCVTCRIGVCGFTFWRVSAKCWLVDEDAHGICGGVSRAKVEPAHRQGTIFGAITLMQNAAGGICASLIAFGISKFGLRTINCEDQCSHLTGEENNVCMDTCFRVDIVGNQPDDLRFFIRVVLGFIAPVFELMVAFHTYSFPIKGTRLRRLYYTVMEEQGDHSYLENKMSNASYLDGGIVPEIQSHNAASKIALVAQSLDDVKKDPELQSRISNALAIADSSPKRSCAIIIETLDQVSRAPSSPTSPKTPKSVDASDGQVGQTSSTPKSVDTVHTHDGIPRTPPASVGKCISDQSQTDSTQPKDAADPVGDLCVEDASGNACRQGHILVALDADECPQPGRPAVSELAQEIVCSLQKAVDDDEPEGSGVDQSHVEGAVETPRCEGCMCLSVDR